MSDNENIFLITPTRCSHTGSHGGCGFRPLPSKRLGTCGDVVVMMGKGMWTALRLGAGSSQKLGYINATVARLDSRSLAEGRRISTARLLLSILCVFLVLLGSTLEAAHSHPGHAASHADCALCATAHVAIQITASPVLPAVVTLVEAVQRLAAPPPSRPFSVYALFTRPPPSVLTLA